MNSPVPNRNRPITTIRSTEIDVNSNDEEIVEIDLSAIPAGGPLKKSSKDKHKKQAKNWNWKQDHFSSLEDALMCPDLYGPIRIPRYGTSDRTVLCLEKMVQNITGSTTNVVNGIVALTSYSGSVAMPITATAESVAFSTGTGITPGILYPPPASLTDVSLVALSMTISYIGKPLDAQGTVLLCTIPDAAGVINMAGATFSGLSYLPNAVVVPVSSLLDEPLRVSLLHMSPSSWEFISPTSAYTDVAVPLICTNGLAVGTNCRVEITATYEGRTAISSANAIPYEHSTASKAADLSLFEDVVSDLGEMFNQVSEYLPSSYTRAAMASVRDVGEGFIAKGVQGLAHYASNRILNSVLHGGGSEFRRAIRN